jgi:hypothetical protein
MYIQNPLPAGKKVYIIGQEGIGEELDLLNIPHIGGPADNAKIIKLGTLCMYMYRYIDMHVYVYISIYMYIYMYMYI